jgi:hypothetical protein
MGCIRPFCCQDSVWRPVRSIQTLFKTDSLGGPFLYIPTFALSLDSQYIYSVEETIWMTDNRITGKRINLPTKRMTIAA